MDVGHLVGQGVELVGRVLTASGNKVLVDLGPLRGIVVIADHALDADQSGLHVPDRVRSEPFHLVLVDVHSSRREVTEHVRDEELGVVRGVDVGEVTVDRLHGGSQRCPGGWREAVLAIHGTSHTLITEANKHLLAVLLHHEDVGIIVCARIRHFTHGAVNRCPHSGGPLQDLCICRRLAWVSAQQGEERLPDLIALSTEDGVLVLGEDVCHQIGGIVIATKSPAVFTSTSAIARRTRWSGEVVLIGVNVSVSDATQRNIELVLRSNDDSVAVLVHSLLCDETTIDAGLVGVGHDQTNALRHVSDGLLVGCVKAIEPTKDRFGL